MQAASSNFFTDFLPFIVHDRNAALCWCDLKEERGGFLHACFFNVQCGIRVEARMEITTLKYILLFTMYLSSPMLKAVNI